MFLLDKLPLSIRSIPLEFYFDNYFTSLPLLNQLSLLNYRETGTIRENQVPKDCPLKLTKVMKRGKRGDIDIAFDDNHNLALVRWKDNAIITLASNQHAVAPMQKARCWSFVENKCLTVHQPFVVHCYKTYMGDTDRMDQNINSYCTTIRTKKWYWTIFSWMLDVTAQNSWLIYCLEHDDIDHLEFRSMTARALLKKTEPRKSTGRPKILASIIILDIQFDKIGHYIVPLGRQM